MTIVDEDAVMVDVCAGESGRTSRDGRFSQEPEAIRHELETLDVSRLPDKTPDLEPGAQTRRRSACAGEKRVVEKAHTPETQAWIDAVVATCTTSRGGAALVLRRSRGRDLIVVGAVYDFAMTCASSGQGQHRQRQRHTDPAKIASFLRASTTVPPKAAPRWRRRPAPHPASRMSVPRVRPPRYRPASARQRLRRGSSETTHSLAGIARGDARCGASPRPCSRCKVNARSAAPQQIFDLSRGEVRCRTPSVRRDRRRAIPCACGSSGISARSNPRNGRSADSR